jgi:hypothetical protein
VLVGERLELAVQHIQLRLQITHTRLHQTQQGETERCQQNYGWRAGGEDRFYTQMAMDIAILSIEVV